MKRVFLISLLLMAAFIFSGCSAPNATRLSINNELFSAGDKIKLSWDSVEDAESYKVSFYIYPLSENKLARSVELTELTWDGDMPMGKYDVVVFAKKKKTLSDSSNKITFTVESQSIPGWDDINYIFVSTSDQVAKKYGTPSVESNTGTSVLKTYDNPEFDLTYSEANSGKCSQIDIYDKRFILFKLTLGVNTQADLLSALTQNNISYENLAGRTNAGANKYTQFNYNDYQFLVYVDSKNLLSFITIKKP